jgi:hypothetical protein
MLRGVIFFILKLCEAHEINDAGKLRDIML